ncbi:hypothetical protein [Sulfurimonas sp.]
MMDFIKKSMDWVLEKEDEVAKKCAIKPEDVEKQIKSLEQKREQLKKKYNEEDAEMQHILSRLSIIKADASKCSR